MNKESDQKSFTHFKEVDEEYEKGDKKLAECWELFNNMKKDFEGFQQQVQILQEKIERL